ncbi:hypothetical protein NDU88_001417 [Pleurodeles waltl]|uniref:Uncharacterized protein n=1 Tax=Pleurodeles waltl TaxID=8319 RepID=A0AAV7R711_PLEWA|nr:hypothetical protein NDU88_001417 [Pleurodeles waltl]
MSKLESEHHSQPLLECNGAEYGGPPDLGKGGPKERDRRILKEEMKQTKLNPKNMQETVVKKVFRDAYYNTLTASSSYIGDTPQKQEGNDVELPHPRHSEEAYQRKNDSSCEYAFP